jgi:hypothetical protein
VRRQSANPERVRVFGKRSLQRQCAYFSANDQTPFHSADGAVTRNCSMRSRNSLLVAAADNRGTEISAKESAANNMGTGLTVQRSDRRVGMLPAS